MEKIPFEITIYSFSIIGILFGYIWNDQNKKINYLKKKQNELPCNSIFAKIESIKTDIAWIKQELRDQKK